MENKPSLMKRGPYKTNPDKAYKYKGKERAYRREYWRQHREHYLEMRRQSYYNNHEKQAEYHKNYRWLHPEYREKQIQRSRALRTSLRLEILTHYGNGKCACVKCGESRLACLSIDHILGKGNAHRKLLGKEGTTFYWWLKKNQLPSGYQTLCMNCQFCKRVENNESPKGRQCI